MDKTELIAALAAKFDIEAFHDVSNNGLQVDSRRKEIRKVVTGVDATLPLFKTAVEAGADLVICHHGISWGDSLKRITGLNYDLVKFLMDNDLALWACHLPLDAHAELGNNAGICNALGLVDRKPFGEYHGQRIGFSGRLPSPMSRDAFADLVRDKIGQTPHTALFGPETIETVGVISGGAADMVSQAADNSFDAYVDGEMDLAAYNLCLQRGINMFSPGHYATERFGVRALGGWLESSFGIEHQFVDFDIPW